MEKKLSIQDKTFNSLIIFAVSLALLFLSTQSLAGRNFYFSTSIGNDSRTSTQAQNPSTPWKTITKLNSFFPSLAPGDSVLFKRGESFYGSIIVTKSGTSTLPIIIGAYGTGAKPIISGFSTISSWTSLGGGIYQSSASSCKPTLNMVTMNGEQKAIGRYPNSGYLTFEAASGSSSITDNELSGTPNWTGAELIIRKRHWIIDRNRITNHSGTTLTYNSGSSYTAWAGYGYFIQGDNKTLDLLGEWYLNPTNKTLQMYFGANNPANYSVKASSIDTLIYINGSTFITFDNLSLQGANVAAFYINYGQYIKIQYCSIDYSGNDGIKSQLSNYTSIENSEINHSNNKAIVTDGPYTTIRNNSIKNTGMIPGMGQSDDGTYTAVGSNGNNAYIEYNRIDSSGYVGITMGGNNLVIKNNYINYFLAIKDDGGGIYSGDLNIAQSKQIIGNIILNGKGNNEGAPNSGFNRAHGIYIEGNPLNINIFSNTIANCDFAGIYLHFTQLTEVRGNTMFNNGVQLLMGYTDISLNPIRTTNLKKNIFFSKKASQMALNYTSLANDIALFGNADSNYYCRPLDDNCLFYTSYKESGKAFWDAYDLSKWITTFNKDQHSTKSPVTQNEYTLNSLISGDKIANGTFNSNISGIGRLNCNTSWNNTGVLDGGCLQLSPGTPSPTSDLSYFTVSIGAVESNKNYILKFSAKGTNASATMDYYVRQLYSPWSALTEKRYFKVLNSRSEYELLISFPVSESNALINFEFKEGDGTLWIDNLHLYEANVNLSNPDDFIRFEFNATSSNKTIALDNSYVGVDGTLYSNSITLTPYTSVVLTKNPNQAPIIQNQSFQLNENSPNNTFVGTVIASDPNPGQSLTYSILSGNTNGAFSINTTTGVLRVSNFNMLDFETTPSFTLIVRVQDNGFGNLSSQANIIVSLINVNEAPVISNQTFTIPEYSSNGTPVGTVLATDQDAGQTKTFSIIWGNIGNTFSIDAATGVLSVLNSSSLNYFTTPTYALLVKVQDNGTGLLSSQATITVNVIPSGGCTATGNISYQVWDNILGTGVVDLTSNANYPNNPSSTSFLTSMQAPSNFSNNYGARIAGYICAPQTGSYTFWITSDDNGELWLSTNNQSANKQRIAYHNSFTGPTEWNKFSTQKSVVINLIQGQSYYIEALMKEGGGGDNLAVGWLKPGQSGSVPSEIIPGSVLSPIGTTQTVLVTSVSIPSTSIVNFGASVTLPATVLPANATNPVLTWTSGNTTIATVNSYGMVTGISAGIASITATSTDGSNMSASCNLTVNPPVCSATGNITYQIWNDIIGVDVSSLTSNINYPNNPTTTQLITSMEGATNVNNNYGARIAGYICAPATGSYTFWIASDDNSELWLSTNDQPAYKQRIAFHVGYTGIREWNKYTTQKSTAIYLVQGQKYYIEALMKEGGGGDNLAVGWIKPGQSGTVPSEIIPGSVLSPIGTTQTVLVTSVNLPSNSTIAFGSSITLSATVLPGNATNPTLSWNSSNTGIATVNSNGTVTGISAGNASITATSTDGSNKSSTCIVTVNSPVCSATGNIKYEVWNNIGNSSTVSSLTSNINFPNNPSSVEFITSMQAPSNYLNDFGARISGYICAPLTGSYTFWIASDDNGELWLSTNNQPANRQKIAYHTSFTGVTEWDKFPTQKSAVINLVQGQSYYVEALMKEAGGAEHMSVAWLKPGQSGSVPSEIIPGSVLSPIGTTQSVLVTSVSLPSASVVDFGASITLSATVLPGNATNPALSWTSSNTAIATVNSNGMVTGISAGIVFITAISTDGSNKSASCNVTVNPPTCSASGNVTYEVWYDIGSSPAVISLTSNINYPNNPSSTSLLPSMQMPGNYNNNFGTRISGYICAPLTGSYTFWIASDDNGELWLSSNDQAANKQLIAFHTSFTGPAEWNKFTTQKSAVINLTQGQSYYIEALMKEAGGGENLAVGWLKPGQTGTIPSEVIPGSVLSPIGNKSVEISFSKPSESEVKLSVYPNPLSTDVLNIKIDNLSSEASLKIYTIAGVECHVEQLTNSGTIHIDRSVFKSGIYVIKIFNDQFIKTAKLVVK